MKRLTRRVFLKALCALGLSSFLPPAISGASSEVALTRNMEALTEAIMPGAGDLGVHEKVIDTVSKRRDEKGIFVSGMDSLEKYSIEKFGQSFYSLKEDQKDSVLAWMAGLAEERHEKFFFRKYRQIVLAHYYASPAVWKTLKYNGPPQPNGFMDYHLPPK